MSLSVVVDITVKMCEKVGFAVIIVLYMCNALRGILSICACIEISFQCSSALHEHPKAVS
jgi:hypothetical protein